MEQFILVREQESKKIMRTKTKMSMHPIANCALRIIRDHHNIMDKMRLLIFIVLSLFVFIPIHSQNLDSTTIYNRVDSLGNKIGIWIDYDIECIKLSEAVYSESGEWKSVKFFTRSGIELNDCVWNCDDTHELFSQLYQKIANHFIFKERMEAVGNALFTFIFNHERNIYELRVWRGINPEFDKELIRVMHVIEQDSVRPTPTNTATNTLLTIFTFSPFKRIK